ncbi:putative ribonuclease H-like domain-containing protein [Tanacetum coccineum]
MDEFCGQKGIKREYSVARTPQQNGVAERKNRTLIEATRTMLADSLLPTIFWAEAVNTACYVLNRVLVTKRPYELIIGRAPSISFMRPFGCPVTILNTLDPLGKFDRKAEEGFLVGYSVNSKAFRSSISSSYKSSDDKIEDNTADDATGKKNVQEPTSECDQALTNVLDRMMNQEKEATEQSDAVRKDTTVNTINVFKDVNTASALRTFSPPHAPLMLELEDTAEMQRIGTFGNAYDDDDLETNNNPYAGESVGAEADFNNMEPSTVVSPIHITRIHSTHPKAQIIGDPKSAVQTRGMTKKTLDDEELGLKQCKRSCFSQIQEGLEPLVNLLVVLDEFNGRTYFLLGFKSSAERGYGSSLRSGQFMLAPDFKVRPRFLHLNDIKRIFRYLKSPTNLAPLVSYGTLLLHWKLFQTCKKQTVVANSTTEADTFSALSLLWSTALDLKLDVGLWNLNSIYCMNKDSCCNTELNLLRQILILLRIICIDWKRGGIVDTKIPQSGGPPIKVGDEAVHKELGDRMERAATTASSFDVVVPGAKKPHWGM